MNTSPSAAPSIPTPTLPRYPLERAGHLHPAPSLLGLPPVSPLRFAGGAEGLLVTGFEAARAVLSNPLLSAERWRGDDPVRPVPRRVRERRGLGPGAFLATDDPEHARYRTLLTGQFTVRRMRALQPRVEQVVEHCLDGLEAAGRPADLVAHFALPVPSLIICELLGVPYTERDRFQRASGTLLRQDLSAESFDAAVDAIDAFLGEMIAAKRRSPDDDLVSLLIASGQVTDEEICGMCRLLLVAGHETTMNMLSLGTFALLNDPEQLARLRADDDLVPFAVEELLRYLAIVNAFPVRTALEDTEIAGVPVPAGTSVAVSVPAANRDPALVEDPDRLDVGRRRSSHLAFGYGIHQCLGQHLARIELAAGYRGLLRRFPALRLAVPADAVPLRSDMVIYGAHELPVTW
ncbi:putative cytochrome P450 [Actinacidiphila reveromycinica]|uniref:Putative cytochrome P450 n=1 Tax=Actinacidiphila reveromycinica TaxID=659352 RepID=A0A7U3VQZ1_9ACTN|nr:cytochrome P450 [Streptomyces sp. SN-593]BBB00333.1 putative cytochrome P450 [Streptomyces sp. SN-593]